MEGVDYSDVRPHLGALWDAGKRFVCRYLAYQPNPKVLLPSELQALHAHGFGVVLNWEQASGDMFLGFDRGTTHAREALRQANALGAPATVPIYFSCDRDVTNNAELTAVSDYLHAATTILGRNRVGVYGEYDVIEAMVGNVCNWGWQTYAWSNGKVSDKAHILQYKNGVMVAGGDCDLDRSLQPVFGAWSGDVNLGDIVQRSGKDVGSFDRTVEQILGDVEKFRLWGCGNITGAQAGYGPNTPFGVLERIANDTLQLVSDDQIKALAAQLAHETDATVIETALRNVLREGVGNA